MVDSQPDFSLGVENATQIAPGHRKVGPSLDGFQVTGLGAGERGGREKNIVKKCYRTLLQLNLNKYAARVEIPDHFITD